MASVIPTVELQDQYLDMTNSVELYHLKYLQEQMRKRQDTPLLEEYEPLSQCATYRDYKALRRAGGRPSKMIQPPPDDRTEAYGALNNVSGLPMLHWEAESSRCHDELKRWKEFKKAQAKESEHLTPGSIDDTLLGEGLEPSLREALLSVREWRAYQHFQKQKCDRLAWHKEQAYAELQYGFNKQDTELSVATLFDIQADLYDSLQQTEEKWVKEKEFLSWIEKEFTAVLKESLGNLPSTALDCLDEHWSKEVLTLETKMTAISGSSYWNMPPTIGTDRLERLEHMHEYITLSSTRLEQWTASLQKIGKPSNDPQTQNIPLMCANPPKQLELWYDMIFRYRSLVQPAYRWKSCWHDFLNYWSKHGMEHLCRYTGNKSLDVGTKALSMAEDLTLEADAQFGECLSAFDAFKARYTLNKIRTPGYESIYHPQVSTPAGEPVAASRKRKVDDDDLHARPQKRNCTIDELHARRDIAHSKNQQPDDPLLRRKKKATLKLEKDPKFQDKLKNPQHSRQMCLEATNAQGVPESADKGVTASDQTLPLSLSEEGCFPNNRDEMPINDIGAQSPLYTGVTQVHQPEIDRVPYIYDHARQQLANEGIDVWDSQPVQTSKAPKGSHAESLKPHDSLIKQEALSADKTAEVGQNVSKHGPDATALISSNDSTQASTTKPKSSRQKLRPREEVPKEAAVRPNVHDGERDESHSKATKKSSRSSTSPSRKAQSGPRRGGRAEKNPRPSLLKLDGGKKTSNRVVKAEKKSRK